VVNVVVMVNVVAVVIILVMVVLMMVVRERWVNTLGMVVVAGGGEGAAGGAFIFAVGTTAFFRGGGGAGELVDEVGAAPSRALLPESPAELPPVDGSSLVVVEGAFAARSICTRSFQAFVFGLVLRDESQRSICTLS
jgi:hypothetical protein